MGALEELASSLERAVRASAERNGIGFPHFGLPTRKWHRLQVVPAQFPDQKLEGRPNMLATNGSWSVVDVEGVQCDPGETLRKSWKDWEALPAVSKLVEQLRLMETAGHASEFGVRDSPGLDHIERYAALGLGEGLVRLDMGRELTDWSTSQSRRFEKSLKSTKELVRWVAPICNFKLEAPGPVDISGGIVIRPVTEEETDQLADPKSLLGLLRRRAPVPLMFSPPEWVAELEDECQAPGQLPSSDDFFRKMSQLVTGFQVFKSEKVDWLGTVLFVEPNATPTMGSENPSLPAFLRWSAFDPVYEVPDIDVSALKATVDEVVAGLSAGGPAWLVVSCTRLKDAMGRESDRDRLVDGVIALESILLHGSQDELKYRFAGRGSALLGGTSDGRLRLWNLFRSAYDRRSAIVHGSPEYGKPEADEVLLLVRRVIRAAMELTKRGDLKSVLADLDEFIVSRSDARSFLDSKRVSTAGK